MIGAIKEDTRSINYSSYRDYGKRKRKPLYYVEGGLVIYGYKGLCRNM